MKKIIGIILGIILLLLLIQIIRYNYAKYNVKKALNDAKLRDEYKNYTKDGYNIEDGHTTAVVSVFPFCIKLFKWNNTFGDQPCTEGDCMYWDNCK